jgi:hypothetical protein
MSDQLPTPRRALRGEVVGDQPAGPPSAVDWLELLSFVMDRLFTVPGTDKRFGLNSLMLLFPVVGALLPALISFGIVAIGLSHRRVPRIVAVRMVLNVLLDAGISWIPFVGNVWDVWFKADSRNVRLLRECLGRPGEPPPPTWQHWLFVIGLLALLALFFLGLAVLVVLLVDWLLGRGRAAA